MDDHGDGARSIFIRKISIRNVIAAISSLLLCSMSVGQAAMTNQAAKVHVWLTTADQTSLLQQQPDIDFTSTGLPNPLTIQVEPSQAGQEIDGFGAALTDSSAWLLYNKLSPSQKSLILRQLFDPQAGIGLSVLRLPMGASDFALSPYTYDDNGGVPDPLLANFTIQHDEAYIIPLMKEILSIHPQIKIFAVPWSAPAWMKTSNSLNGGQLKQEYYAVYAAYFVKFILAYQAHAIPIYAVSIQNEPLHETSGYPSMLFPAANAVNFIKNYLAPAFAINGITAKIIAYDHNWDNTDYPLYVLNELSSFEAFIGTAYHCYGGDVASQSLVHDLYPMKDIYFTECTGWGVNPDFGADLKWVTEKLTIGAVRNWAKTVLRWNLALDTNFGPRIGGCENCYGVLTIDQDTGKVTYTSDFYALGHASKFVQPGARRIASNTFPGELENVAFLNPDRSLVLLVLNSSTISKTFQVTWAGKSFTYSLAAGAVATFTWRSQIYLPLVMGE